ncbi:MAG: 30S ribosomal protein S2 [Candidatus Nanoarchaeia archaeon]|nr:30S ribosomal protein S2 [Candidatus Nanoarchaeia archaeon]MDD5588200.1 30S ribosomal protein S2 [Candidatus Nanoarchaeia archaeon]
MAETQLLIPLDEYLKAGVHIGTKLRTKDMSPFVYKIRPDGLCVLNVEEINKRVGIAANFISQYDPKDILIVCRRETGWSIVNLFAEATGIRVLTGRYPPGILTNIKLETFMETKLVLVVDPLPDKNTVNDCYQMGVPIIALCDSNNDAGKVDLVIPCNNKGKKSLGLIFYVLAKEYLKKRGIISSDAEFKYKIEDFSKE